MEDAGTVATPSPNKVALAHGDERRTFGELNRRVNQVAHVLAAMGVEPHDGVALLMPGGIPFFEASLGAGRAAARMLTMNWNLSDDDLAWILADSGVKVLVIDESFVNRLNAITAQAPNCGVLVVGEEGARSFEAAVGAASDVPPRRRGWPTPAYIYYTSGTTGRPRGVEREFVPDYDGAMQQGLAAMWGLVSEDVYIASGPSYHGACIYAFTALFVGQTVVIQPDFEPLDWFRLVERHGVTCCFMPPASFIRLLEVPADVRASFDTSSLRFIFHAGAPCPLQVKAAIMAALPSADIWEFYGAGEGGITRISSAEWRAHPGSVGTPWPGVELRVLGVDGEPLPAGQPGLVYMRTAARFHYRNDPEKTARAWLDDAYTVGDVGYLDEDGYLYLVDRAADAVVRDGESVYPTEIENALFAHDAVVDCAAFGVRDAADRERLVAVVEVRRPVGTGELLDHCVARLGLRRAPDIVEQVEHVPRDPNGKVLKRQLREARSAAAPN